MTTNKNTLRTEMVDGESYTIGAGAVTVFTFLFKRKHQPETQQEFAWWKVSIRLHIQTAVNLTKGFDRTLEDALNMTAADAWRMAAPHLGLPEIEHADFEKAIEVRANFIDVVYWIPNEQK